MFSSFSGSFKAGRRPKNNQPPSGPAWQPSNVNAVAWFDASDTTSYVLAGSTLTSVTDKAGNFTMDMPTAPTKPLGGLNGLPVWDFSSGAHMISTNSGPYSDNGNHWAIGVYRWDEVDNDKDSFWSASGTRTYAISSSHANNSWPGEIDYDNANSIVTGIGRNTFTQPIPRFAWTIVTIVFNKDGGKIFGRLNGTTRTAEHTYALSLDTNCTDLRMMRNRGSRRVSGRMAEYFHVADIPGTGGADISDVEKAEGYLAHKWGLESNLPNTHPYKTVAPTT